MRKLEWTLVAALLAVCAGFPLFQAGYEVLIEKESPHLFDLFHRMPNKENLHRWDDNAKDRSVFAKWLRPKTLQLRYEMLGEVAPKSLQGVEGWLFYRQDVDYLLQPPYRDARFYKGTFDTLIAGRRVNLRDPLVAITDFRDRLKARGIELLLAPIPGKPSIYPEKLWKGIQGQPASPTLQLLEELQDRGFQVVDLFASMLKAKAAAGSPLYLERDTHWTPQGMDVAAEAIAVRIQAMGLTGDSAGARPSRYGLKDSVVERWGDIAEMTKVPDRKKIWATEKVSARQVLDLKTGKPYQDDPDSRILWLGDSFSRIYQTDAPTGSGLIAHIAYRLNRPLASLVNDGGASTMVRRQLSLRKGMLDGKKLVVWAFVERDLRFGSQGWKVLDLP